MLPLPALPRATTALVVSMEISAVILLAQFRNHGQDACQFFFRRNRFRAGAGRFPSHVDIGRALRGHAHAVLDGVFGREKLAAIRETNLG